MVIAIAAVFAALRGCGATTDNGAVTTSAATSARSAVTRSSPSPPEWSPERDGSDADARPSAEQVRAATAVAAGFATDFAAPGAGRDDWLARITRWASPQLVAELAYTDWRRVPTAHPGAVVPTAIGPTVADYIVQYDTGLRIAIRAERDPEWRVTTVLPARPGS